MQQSARPRSCPRDTDQLSLLAGPTKNTPSNEKQEQVQARQPPPAPELEIFAGPHEIPPPNEMTGMKVLEVMSKNVPKNETGKLDETGRGLESGKAKNL